MARPKNFLVAFLVTANLALIGIVAAQWAMRHDGAPAPGGFAFAAEAHAAVDSLGARDGNNPAIAAAQAVSPAVVSVTAVQYVRQRAYDPFYDEFFGPFVPFQFERRSRISEVPMMGSGIIVDEDGYVLTNHHVIEGAAQLTVTLPDGREFDAELIDADVYVDVAVLKIEGEDLPYARLGSSQGLMIGEWVLAIGNPFGQFYEDPRPSVSVGVVSATGRFFQPQSSGRATRVYMDMIQTDAEINPGNSGGPLANLDGEVIGLNTFIISRTGGSQGLGFAIPIDKARAVYEEVRRYGRIRSLMLDLETQPLNRPLARHLGLPEGTQGAVVSALQNNGPAQQAGLEIGDVIVGINGRPVRTPEDLYAYFVTLQVGNQISLDVLHEGQGQEITYTVVEGRRE